MSALGSIMSGAGALLGAVDNASKGTPGQVVPIWELVNSLVSQRGTSNTTGSTQLQEIINQLQQQNTATNSAEQQNQNVTGSQTTQNLSSEQESILNSLLSELSGKLGQESQFSQGSAVAASNDAMQSAIDRVLSSGIGNVAAQGSNFGAYSGTTQGKVASQLAADAAKAGAQTRLDTMTNFGSLQNQEASNLQNAINNLFGNAVNAGGTTMSDQNVVGSTTGSTTGTAESSTTGSNTSNQTSKQDTRTSTTTESTSETDRSYDEIGEQDSLFSKIGNTLGGLFS